MKPTYPTTLAVFMAMIISVGAYAREKDEPVREDRPTESVEPKRKESQSSVSIEGKLHQIKIAFSSGRDGNQEIYTMNPDGVEQKRLTDNYVYDFYPRWSPNGKKIAFQSKRDGNNEIFVMNADGSKQKRLTNKPGNDQFGSWSPDGRTYWPREEVRHLKGCVRMADA